MATSAIYQRNETINSCDLSVTFQKSDEDRSVEFSWGGLVVTCSIDDANVEQIGRIGDTVFEHLQAAAKRGKSDYFAATCAFDTEVERLASRFPGPVRPRLDVIGNLFEGIIQGKKRAPESSREITEEEARSKWQVALPRTIEIVGPEAQMTDASIKAVLEACSDYFKTGQDLARIDPWNPVERQFQRIRKVMGEELVRVYHRTGLMIADL